MTQQLSYRPDVDGLRAVAVLAVVVFHAFPNALPGGFAGVDVFFVISGYLISLIILKGLNHGDFSIKEFYARRIRRIFPALLTVIAVCLFAGWHSLFPLEYKQLAKSALTSLAFAANIGFWAETGYFDGDAELKPLLHLWSLGVEEQFYLVWPLLLLGAWRTGMRRLLQLCFALALLSLAASVVLTPRYPGASYFLPFTRAWELLAGSLLALASYHQHFHWTRAQLRDFFSLLGFALIVCGFFVIDSSRHFPGAWALLPVIGTSLLIATGPPAIVNRLLLASKPLVWVGLISFPLYLWHWPLLTWLRILSEGAPAATHIWGAISLALLASVLTYHLIEKPIRHQRKRWVVPGLIASGALLMLGSSNIYHRDGLSFRLKDAQTREAAKSLEWGTEMRFGDQCAPYLPPGVGGECLIADPSRPPDALLLGDSHANHYYWVLRQTLLDQGYNLMQIAAGACPVLKDFVASKDDKVLNGHCSGITAPALEFAVSASNIRIVFVASRWPSYISGREMKHAKGEYSKETARFGGRQVTSTEHRHRLFEAALAAPLEMLKESGKHTVFLHSIPEMAFHPRECVSWSPNGWLSRTPRAHCFTSNAEIEERMKDYRPTLDKVLNRFPSLVQIDPARVMCDDEGCKAVKENILLYRDDDHLSRNGASWLAERMGRTVRAAVLERK